MHRFLRGVAKKAARGLIRIVGAARVTRLGLEAWADVNECGESAARADTALESVVSSAWHRVIVDRFFSDDVGREYKVSRNKKVELLRQFQTNTVEIPTGTSWLFHLVLAQEILSLPKTLSGDVVECGCWKGASAASLSLVCGIVGRKLIVCDSFQGLPAEGYGTVHQYPHIGVFGYYEEGMLTGPLDEVKANIAAYGDLSCCEFLPGFFCDSLKQLKDPVVFAFLDVDLASSMKDCVKSIWPLLADGCAIYTDDSCDMEVVRIWFDDVWWQLELGTSAPGYVGSGCGLPLDLKASSLGYIRKVLSPETVYAKVPWLYYPDTR